MSARYSYPHKFVGRLDRWCEVCNRPDRDPIHKMKEYGAMIGYDRDEKELELIGRECSELSKEPLVDGYTTKEWAKLFLKKWDRAVELWDNGNLFREEELHSESPIDQRQYATLCCTWIIPNGMVEPHCVAQGD